MEKDLMLEIIKRNFQEFQQELINQNTDGTLWFYKRTLIFSKCLRIAKVSLLGRILIDYIQEQTWHPNSSRWIPYVPYNIDKKCFDAPNGNKTKLAIKNLINRNIIEFDDNAKNIAINFKIETWNCENYDKIMEVIRNRGIDSN